MGNGDVITETFLYLYRRNNSFTALTCFTLTRDGDKKCAELILTVG